jgi:monoamine oxidase
VVEACLAQLARLFGPEAAAPSWHMLQDWSAEPFTAHADDATDGRHPEPMPSRLPAPWDDRVRLAGSEHAQEHPGYLEGAVAAANTVVDTLA